MNRDHSGFALWLTGLPCSGKSTIADAVAKELRDAGHNVERLDADDIRKRFWPELGYSKEDRDKNISRVTWLAKLLTRNGVVVVLSFVSPYREAREQARKEIGDFIEVYVKCPLEVCMERDTRGLYQRAIRGEIEQFTGVSAPYEEPTNPDIIVETDRETVEMSTRKVLAKIEENS